MNTPPLVKFSCWECTPIFGYYKNGRTAIWLKEANTGEPIAKVTVNIPEEFLEDDEVIIKTYAENKGMLAALQKAGIVGEPVRVAVATYEPVPICKLLFKPENHL